MGFDNFSTDDVEEQDENSDPSGTHIYFYEEGHDRLPEDEEVASVLAEAYELARTQPTDGEIRDWADSNWSGGIVHMLAEYVVKLGEMREEKSLVPVIELILGDVPADLAADEIDSFLEQNPETGSELMDRLHEDETEEPAAAEADD